MELQAQRRGAREAEHHGLAPRRRKTLLGRFAHQRGAIAVGQDKPRRCGDDLAREIGGNGEIEPVAIVEVVLPFAVGLIVEQAGLDLDNGDIAAGRKRHHVGAPAIGQRQFGDDREAERPEGAADAALYWFVRMLDGGADPRYMARRFIRMASEDIGLADPRALRLALDAAEVYERLGTPEGELALAECVVYLAVAPKSNAVYKAFNEAKAFVKKDGTRPVPMHLRNAPTKLMKELDYGKGYRYAHDEAGGFAAGERYLPDGMAGPDFYRPVERGLEIRIADKLRELKKLNNQNN